ncbi:hypothetical protein [Methanococcus aeolicus]|uniref:hypothetical protein n=1 Tax=Methanococcus aeolicus TaxID=42879 RepID=UPI0021C576B1|nr:hypothetical protein [Methanococcus aeolicus]UXM84570.1 hypothetical protein N6C89_07475 [Methanococcus aeolicus]
MDYLLKIILLMVIFLFILLTTVFYRGYKQDKKDKKEYKKAKKSWKILYGAKIDSLENFRYNLKNNIFTNKFFIMFFIIGIPLYIFEIIWGIIHKNILHIFFNGAILLYFIILFVIFKKPNLLTKFGLKPILKNIGICDKGVIYNQSKRIFTWEQFKGYKKNNEHIYLMAKKKPNNISALKYSKKLENIIKDFLNEIN